MDAWISFARGPLLIFTFAVCLLGVLRLLALLAAEFIRAFRAAGNRAIPWKWILRQSLGWLVPVKALRLARIPFTVASVLFHVAVFGVPMFFAGHVALVRRAFGISWPSLPGGPADFLTLTACVALATLLLLRFFDRSAKGMSTFQDWLLPVLCLLAFSSGYFAAHPEGSPLPFSAAYLAHLLSSELLLMLFPFTKLAHAVLFPFTRFAWELGWHFVPGAGERVRIALGKEGQPV